MREKRIYDRGDVNINELLKFFHTSRDPFEKRFRIRRQSRTNRRSFSAAAPGGRVLTFAICACCRANSSSRFIRRTRSISRNSRDAATAHNNLGVIAAFGGDWTAAEKQFQTAFSMSGGTLREAARNLKICRFQNANQNLVAELEFTKTINNENEKEMKNGQ